MIHAFNPKLIRTCIFISLSIYLFIGFGSRLEQKSSFDKKNNQFKAYVICDYGCHEFMV